LHVISSASREETIKWTKKRGADETVNHRKNLVSEVRNLGYRYVDYILELNNLDQHWNEMADLIVPNGKIASITENKNPIDLKKLTKKRATFAWEWMYSKSYFETPDEQTQHDILEHISEMLDAGKITSTATTVLHPIDAQHLREAHKMVESNHMIGKVVLTN
jgi:NADPH:quinone reductase-like Zn-dependent oxidoreductase